MNNLKKYSRLFTFGCSFTQYHWPTWADILGQEAQEFQNWGLSGGGNDFILNRLVECHQRNTINKKDLVIIMWSSATREDYYNGAWRLRGNIYTCSDVDHIVATRTPEGYLLKSLNYITSAKIILDSIGCEYYFLSMLPIGSPEFNGPEPNDSMLELYRDTLNLIKPSVFETVYNGNWDNAKLKVRLNYNGRLGYDPHPVTSLHLEYLIKTFPDLRVSNNTRNFVDQWTTRLSTLTREDHDKIVDPAGHGRLYPIPEIKAF